MGSLISRASSAVARKHSHEGSVSNKLSKQEVLIDNSKQTKTFRMGSDSKTYCVVDFNFYHDANGGMIVKELAVVQAPKMQRQQWVFGPPHSESDLSVEVQAVNRKFQDNVVYKWHEGDVPYSRLPTILSKAVDGFKNVFASGMERSQLIADIISRPVYDMKTLHEWVKYGAKLNEQYYRYQYASVCLTHMRGQESHCSKARCTYLASILDHHEDTVFAGKTGMRKIHPDVYVDSIAPTSVAAVEVVTRAVESGRCVPDGC